MNYPTPMPSKPMSVSEAGRKGGKCNCWNEPTYIDDSGNRYCAYCNLSKHVPMTVAQAGAKGGKSTSPKKLKAIARNLKLAHKARGLKVDRCKS